MGKRIKKDLIKSLIDSKKLIVILGPTASGKTDTSIELSKLINLEIISADSRQIYHLMDIGTAKPTSQELDTVIHHFINIKNPDEYYSAGIFGDDAEKIVVEIFKKNKIPVVVGGSGLYIKSLCEGFFKESDIDAADKQEIRQKLENRLESKGISVLYDELKLIDPASANLYPDMNPRRILRALEFYEHSGIAFSDAQKNMSNRDFTPFYFGIHFERKELYNRINQRSENIWKKGLIEETMKILKLGYSPELNSLNTVGYKEAIAYLEGKLSESDALEEMKKNTRHYAKRQMTWFRKKEKIIWLSGKPKKIAEEIVKISQNQLD